MQKKRIIFFAEAVTLAHVARCVALANELEKTNNYVIALASDDRYDKLLGDLPYERIPLHSVASQYFAKKLAKGAPLYSAKILTEYVEEDLNIIESFKPDFIFGDFRLSLAISSKLKKIPYATITNAYWSPYANITYPVPELPLTKIFGVTIAQKLFNLVKPIVFFIHSLAFNKTCKKFGLPPLAYDMREVYTHADHTLYADIESLIPMKPLPEHHHFIGPVLWSAQVDQPDWWEEVPTDKPVVFVTMGSSGESKLLPMILEALSELSVSVMCVTANKTTVGKIYDNQFIAEFIHAEAAVKKADIVICNGGSPMVYQSLVENKCVIGVPSNLDQYLMMSLIEQWNRVVFIRSGKSNKNKIRASVALLLEDQHKASPQCNSRRLSLESIESIIRDVS